VPNLGEYRDLLKRRDPLPPTSHPFQQRSALIEPTHKAQTVVDHPGWQWFLDQIETKVQTLERERQMYVDRLTGDEQGQPLDHWKMRFREVSGTIAGLRYAATLIPNAVTLGQTIAGELRQAAAGRDDASRS
jgi:hypothetical protein